VELVRSECFSQGNNRQSICYCCSVSGSHIFIFSVLHHAARFPSSACPSSCCFVDELKQRCLPIYLSPCVDVIIRSHEPFTFISSTGCHGGIPVVLGAGSTSRVHGHLVGGYCEEGGTWSSPLDLAFVILGTMTGNVTEKRA
jgi:hypothetical protein